MSLILLCSISIILMIVAIRKDFGPMGKKSRRPDYDSPRYLQENTSRIVNTDLDREPEVKLDSIHGDIEYHAPIFNKESLMGKFTFFVLGFMLASSLALTTTLSYFLFCPHAKHVDKTIIITPPDLLPNPMLPEIPKRMAPLHLGGWDL